MGTAEKTERFLKCLLWISIFAVMLLFSGKSMKAAEIEPVRLAEGTPDVSLKGAFTGAKGFHAFAAGTLIPASGTAIEVKGLSYMRMGATQKLTSSCKNYNGDFLYSSSNTSVANVTNTGEVTAVNSGKATISVQTEPISGSAVICRGTFELTVYSNTYAELTSLSIELEGTTMSPGVKQTAKVKPTPSNAYIEPGFKFDSSDYKVLTVDQNGVITAVSDGTATITATSQDGRDIKGTVSVTVKTTTGISVTGLKLQGESTMVVGDKQTLIALITPLDASQPTVTYRSSTESVATVSADGTVTAVGVGTTEITAMTQDGSNVSSSISITVTGKKMEKITIKGNQNMEVGDTQTLTATVEPANATDHTLKFTSSNTNVLTVSEKGFVSAIAAGTATVTVTAGDGGGASASIAITVTEKQIKVTSIGLNLPGEKEIGVDETRQITAKVFPFNATNPDLEWFSSDEEILSVDGDGNIMGLAPGKAIVIVSATDGTGITARLGITVYEAKGNPTEIALDGNTTMVLDTEQTLAVVLTPAKTIMPELEWTSDNENILNVSDGVVSADGLGTATITASNENGLLRATFTITVVNESVDDNETDDEVFFENVDDPLELKEGESITVQTNFRVDTSTQYLTWKTSNSVVASVNQKGKITARRYGTATITVATQDGSFKEKLKVIVTKKEYKLTFTNLTSKNKLKLKAGRSKVIKYSLQADGAKAASYTWATSKKSVAKVSEKGKVSGVKKGKAVITFKVKLTNGKTIKKSFKAVIRKK